MSEARQGRAAEQSICGERHLEVCTVYVLEKQQQRGWCWRAHYYRLPAQHQESSRLRPRPETASRMNSYSTAGRWDAWRSLAYPFVVGGVRATGRQTQQTVNGSCQQQQQTHIHGPRGSRSSPDFPDAPADGKNAKGAWDSGRQKVVLMIRVSTFHPGGIGTSSRTWGKSQGLQGAQQIVG